MGHWTTDLLEQFEKRLGYDLRPYLPFILGINQDKGLAVGNSSFQVEIEFTEKIQQLRQDYFHLLNQLYQENHLQPIKEWANRLKMSYRAQPYGWAIDSAAAATKLDVVEGESLGFGEDGNDAFRLLAAGRDFGGLEILSDEAGAYLFQGYATTLPQLLETLHKNFMAGVNQTYWHGIPFKFAPGAKWPGFSAFNPMLGGRGFAEAWGPRQPIWEYLPAYTTYLGRLQMLLRQGKSQLDVLVYQAGHNASENTKAAIGESLTKLGYRYQVMTEGLFYEPVKIENNLLLTKGASYRCLVIPRNTYMTTEAKSIIKNWENQGLPIVWQSTNELMDVIQVLGSSIFKNETGDLLTYKRATSQHQFLFCYNQRSQEQSLAGLFQAYNLREWSPWTGTIGDARRDRLQGKELRVFEIVTEEADRLIKNTQRCSLRKSPWTLAVESWEMAASDRLETRKIIHQKKLSELNYWNKIENLQHISGIGTYHIELDNEGRALYGLHIPNCLGSLQVKVNKQEVLGNPITGEYLFNHPILASSIELDIIVASTLNNYLNTSSLVKHYGFYPEQNYGIEEVELLFSIDE